MKLNNSFLAVRWENDFLKKFYRKQHIDVAHMKLDPAFIPLLIVSVKNQKKHGEPRME
jgi:hypothetical protein